MPVHGAMVVYAQICNGEASVIWTEAKNLSPKEKMCQNFTCDWHQLLWGQIQRCCCCRLVTTLWQHFTVLADKDPLLLTSITSVLSDRVMKLYSGKGCRNISLYSFRYAGRWSGGAITCHQYLLSQS